MSSGSGSVFVFGNMILNQNVNNVNAQGLAMWMWGEEVEVVRPPAVLQSWLHADPAGATTN